jgi:hypothetical protein
MPSFLDGEFFSISSLEKYQLALEWSGSSSFPLVELGPAAAKANCASPPCVISAAMFPSFLSFYSSLLALICTQFQKFIGLAAQNPRLIYKQVQDRESA